VFKEAKRNAPSVIYWPHVGRCWENTPNTFKTCITLLLDDIPHDTPIFIIATSDIPVEDLEPELQALFNNYHCFDCNQKIPKCVRTNFWLQLKEQYLRYCCAQEVQLQQTNNSNNNHSKHVKQAIIDNECTVDVDEDEMAILQLRTHIRSICNRLCQKFFNIGLKLDLNESPLTIENMQKLKAIGTSNDYRKYPTVACFLKEMETYINEQEYEEPSFAEDLQESYMSHVSQLHDDALLMCSNINQQLVRRCQQLSDDHLNNNNNSVVDSHINNINTHSNIGVSGDGNNSSHLLLCDNHAEENDAEDADVINEENKNPSHSASPLVLRRSLRINKRKHQKNDGKEERMEDDEDEVLDLAADVVIDVHELQEIINNLVTISSEFTVDEYEEKLHSLLKLLFEYHTNYPQMIHELNEYIRRYMRVARVFQLN
jgi:nitrogen regulatory protein PII-like uncharacterized protein